MPGKTRFGGGSLIGPVTPLPDDDEPPAPTAGEPAVEPERVAAAATTRGKKGPPGTLRINEAAGEALWTAYLEAKTADPFLSFRQFASAVVLAGLDRQAPPQP